MATMRTKVAQVLQHASEQVSSVEQALRQLSVSPNSTHALVLPMPHSLGMNAAALTCHLHGTTSFQCLRQAHTSALSNAG